MGGFARGKAMGVALNMADFDTNEESDAPPVMGMLLVFKDGASPLEGAGPVGVKVPIKNTLGPVLTAAAKKVVALTNSDILLWDAEDRFWEAKCYRCIQEAPRGTFTCILAMDLGHTYMQLLGLLELRTLYIFELAVVITTRLLAIL
ncbi:hypothetical protein BDN71DRAFT_1506265 [Pleurotus eryngii]|uniref:Uncharacterized protein n=1 Tax=Pleurotus eryngii TaxID=5323 RepID=A0A9P5ZYQ1_PLEER|nr:hypothetical protein BDN71DRAFT_1506265 [Pleurotus eryngii]